MAGLEGQDCGGCNASGSTATTLGGENGGDELLSLSGLSLESTSMKRRQASATHSHSPVNTVTKKQKATSVASANDGSGRVAGDNEENIELSGTKGRKKVSKVWEDFTKEKGEDGETLARCNHCKRTFVGSSKSGTTHLRNHLERCLRKRSTVGDQGLKSLLESEDAATSNVIGQNIIMFDQVRSRQDLAKMIIKHRYPLDMFDHVFWKVFLKNLQPGFEFPSQDTIIADILHVYREEKEKICIGLDKLSCRIHAVIYLWQNEPERGKSFYLFLITRFINDDWELKEKVLAVRKLQYDTDAEAIFETFKSLISEWHIENKIRFTTVENNSGIEIDNFTSLLSKQFSITCSSTDHRSFLEHHIDEVLDGRYDIIYMMEKSIQYANTKPDGTCNFLNAVRKAEFQTEEPSALVPKMSDDCFLTLERSLQLRKVFQALEEIDPGFNFNPSVTEWEKASKIYEYLKGIKDTMLSSAAGTNLIAEIYYFKLLPIASDIWCENEESRMKRKIARYLVTEMDLLIAAFLDPRLKFSMLRAVFEEFYGSADEYFIHVFGEVLEHLFRKYESESMEEPLSASLSSDAQPVPELDRNKDESSLPAFLSSDVQPIPEFERYEEETNFPENAKVDILDWWRVNTPKFPTLARMAREFLAIPMSTYPSGSAFSAEVMRICQAFNNPNPEILEALICTKDWLETA